MAERGGDSASRTSIKGGCSGSARGLLPNENGGRVGTGGRPALDMLAEPRACELPRRYESVLWAVPTLATVVYEGARARSAPSLTLKRMTSKASSYSPPGN